MGQANGVKVGEDTLHGIRKDLQLQGQLVTSQQSAQMTGQLPSNSSTTLASAVESNSESCHENTNPVRQEHEAVSAHPVPSAGMARSYTRKVSGSGSLDKQNFPILRRDGSRGNALSNNFLSARCVAPPSHGLSHTSLDASQPDGPAQVWVAPPPLNLRPVGISKLGSALSGELSPTPPMNVNAVTKQLQRSRSHSLPVQVRGVPKSQPLLGYGSAAVSSLTGWAASPVRERSMTPPPPRSVTPPFAGNCTPAHPAGIMTASLPPPQQACIPQMQKLGPKNGMMTSHRLQSTLPRTPTYLYGAGLVSGQKNHRATMW